MRREFRRCLFRRYLAFLLATSLFCSQAIGQSLVNVGKADSPGNTSIETIRVAQVTPTTPTTDGNWLGEIDIDPPVIDHEALESGTSGEQQQFSAGVVDDRGLRHVMLFHRDRSGAQYESAEMLAEEGSEEFTVSVDTGLGQSRIEYYIEALDTGGNRVLKGFPFFPLVRQLTPPTANVTAVSEPSAPESRMIYVLLGVAAVGLALALAGDSDGNPGGNPEPDTVPLNIQVTPP